MNIFKKKQSTNDLVKEIHNSFHNELEEIIQSTKRKIDINQPDEDLKTKANRLRKVGFVNSQPVKDFRDIENNNREKERFNHEQQTLKDAISYFSLKYPLYRFITKESVDKLCEKYELSHYMVDCYGMDVPEKNLKEIENFNILDEDCVYIEDKELIEHRDNTCLSAFIRTYGHERVNRLKGFGGSTDYVKTQLEIVAPFSHFEFSNVEIINPDPIVLHPVMYKDEVYYLIVTAWGEEASDSEVVNSKYN